MMAADISAQAEVQGCQPPPIACFGVPESVGDPARGLWAVLNELLEADDRNVLCQGGRVETPTGHRK
ncbi:MAG: hypothetical protein AAGI53_06075 [Planctomycetota bacterium]